MIYLLNTMPLTFGDGTANAILFFERFFAVAGSLALFFIITIVFKNPVIAFFTALGFNQHFYNPEIFQGGNLTEEYASIFVLIAVLSTVLARGREGISAMVFCGGAGLFFSLAVFTKEPFLLSSFAWFVFLFIGQKTVKRMIVLRGAYFVMGALIPAIFFTVVFLIQGNLSDWLDVLSYNIQYAKQSHSTDSFIVRLFEHYGVITQYIAKQSMTFHILFILGVVGACWWPFVKKNEYAPWIGISAFLMESLATAIGGYEIGHYYLQLVFSYIFMCAVGAAFLLELERKWRLSSFWILILFLLSLSIFDSSTCGLYHRRLSMPCGKIGIGLLSETILESKRREIRSGPIWGKIRNTI